MAQNTLSNIKIIFSAMEVNMINRIKNTMDYQKFSPNSRLSKMIGDTERRYTELSDEDLFFVSAAGESYRMDDENVNADRTTGFRKDL
jgi:hypothetical protein